MTEQILAPIELNDDELLAVSGGVVAVGIAQAIGQSAAVVQNGGFVGIGGGGATSFSGNLSFTQTFAASITQSATNANNGSVSAVVSVSSSSPS
jgi:hypothetical protein